MGDRSGHDPARPARRASVSVNRTANSLGDNADSASASLMMRLPASRPRSGTSSNPVRVIDAFVDALDLRAR